jgi:hypothetical protein
VIISLAPGWTGVWVRAESVKLTATAGRGSNVYEQMKAGWTVTVTSASLCVLQVNAAVFIDLADKALFKVSCWGLGCA